MQVTPSRFPRASPPCLIERVFLLKLIPQVERLFCCDNRIHYIIYRFTIEVLENNRRPLAITWLFVTSTRDPVSVGKVNGVLHPALAAAELDERERLVEPLSLLTF